MGAGEVGIFVIVCPAFVVTCCSACNAVHMS